MEQETFENQQQFSSSLSPKQRNIERRKPFSTLTPEAEDHKGIQAAGVLDRLIG